MMKRLIITSLFSLIAMNFCVADGLPADARKLVERLVEYEDKKLSEMEKSLIKEKKEAMKKLERIRTELDKPKFKWAVKLIDAQLTKYREEIAAMEEAGEKG